MSERLQIPHSIGDLRNAVVTHLGLFETKNPDYFTYHRVEEGSGIEHFDLRFARRKPYYWDKDAPALGFIRLRRLNARLTEMVIEDSPALEIGPSLFLHSDVRMWEDENEEDEPVIPLKKRKAQATAVFDRFKKTHDTVREAVIEGLREDELLLREQKSSAPKPNRPEEAYVHRSRIALLRQVRSPNFDLHRLIRLCEELNKCSAASAHCATAALVRAIIDHVPPIFGARTFAEVANNIGARSTKASLLRLETSCRNIADAVLHQQIRKREVVPNATQINFSNDLDVLLGEIIRRLT